MTPRQLRNQSYLYGPLNLEEKALLRIADYMDCGPDDDIAEEVRLGVLESEKDLDELESLKYDRDLLRDRVAKLEADLVDLRTKAVQELTEEFRNLK